MKRTFKVNLEKESCKECHNANVCKITGIERDKVFQSLANAKLYSFVDCIEAGLAEPAEFMEVVEERL